MAPYIWTPRSPLKLKLLIWRISLGWLPTCNRLATFMTGIPTVCVLCGDEESMDHLFIECSFLKEVWTVDKGVEKISRGFHLAE